MLTDSDATIAAIATPAGRGGVGVVRVSGSAARRLLCTVTQRSSPPAPRSAVLASWYDAQGEVLDRGLVLCCTAPHSYTGEDVVEFHGHGNPVLLRALLARLYELGCRPAEPGEFTRRAVANGKIDLTQAEAVAACIDAATLRAGKQALRQLDGAFGRRITQLMDCLTTQVAHLEACLDFPEEEIPPLFFAELAAEIEQQLLAPLDQLLASAPLGERLFDGAVVAIIGAPNVGKSSLMNHLCGRDRAIVSEIAGTTRDVLEVDFEVNGIPVRLADTAGLRDCDDRIEQEGVRRAEQMAAQADLTIFVADATRPESWACPLAADLLLMNKVDQPHDRAQLPAQFLPISVQDGSGLDRLMDRLAELLGDQAVADEGVLVTRERHRLILEAVREQIRRGVAALGSEAELDLVAMEWRYAWSQLGSMLGIGDVEEILDRVFAEFCIGK